MDELIKIKKEVLAMFENSPSTHLKNDSSFSKEEQVHVNEPSKVHVKEEKQPKKFISTTNLVVQPTKWRPNFDTEGPFSSKTAKEGRCVPVEYLENGRMTAYGDAYWTPLYPTWVAAASADAATRLKNDGFKVLEAELSHDARYHYGGPERQCDKFAKKYTPCANMKDNITMQNIYGKQQLINNYNKYINERNKDTLEDIRLQREIDAQNRWAYSQVIGFTSIPETNGKNKESMKTIAKNLTTSQMQGFTIERANAGHSMALALAGRPQPKCSIESFLGL